MTRKHFLLALAAFVASMAKAADARPRFDPPPVERPPRVVRGAPAPVLGAGLPAIVIAGAALAGYRLWRRRGRSADDT